MSHAFRLCAHSLRETGQRFLRLLVRPDERCGRGSRPLPAPAKPAPSLLDELRQFLRSRDDHGGAAAAGITGGRERAVVQHFDCAHAAEVQVALPPTDNGATFRLERVRRGRARNGPRPTPHARAALRPVPRRSSHPLRRSAGHLQDRAAQARATGAPDNETGAPSRRTIDGAIIDVSRSPGFDAPIRSSSPSMLFKWIPGARDDDAASRSPARALERRQRRRGRRSPRCASFRSIRASPGRHGRAPAQNAASRTASCASIALTIAPPGAGSASPSACSPSPRRTPPLDGGGFERNSWPRYATTIGRRRITR